VLDYLADVLTRAPWRRISCR